MSEEPPVVFDHAASGLLFAELSTMHQGVAPVKVANPVIPARTATTMKKFFRLRIGSSPGLPVSLRRPGVELASCLGSWCVTGKVVPESLYQVHLGLEAPTRRQLPEVEGVLGKCLFALGLGVAGFVAARDGGSRAPGAAL